ncbi:carbohydrate esterase family 5 protein [Zopfia rhizophila CBS 207.26]|uniref:Cutinase n=1 Tax=Zopfia rhizophila CBS 207.26 TaxID=1314779 RepID=A0A6A6E1H4_9PEZI|nr:carbohydrate esterase family 5 protein [Zopfia rhizophila CBS 207.26]
MKYSTATVIAVAGLSSAAPQFSIPSGFNLPSFSFPSFNFPGIPAATSAAGSIGGIPASTPATVTDVAQPTSTGSTGGTVGSNCTPQGNGGGSTENGVADKNCCTDLTVIFARGTGETGNMGTIAGPPMVKALRSKLGADRVTVQGVDYPASAAGNANLGASGGPAMAESVKAALSQCPSTKVVVSGYSQGGMVAHNAFSAQGLTASQVAGAVLFGDPLKSQKVGDLADSNVKQFCASGDLVCQGGGAAITPAHLTYGNNADEAADFVISAAGLS